MKILAIGGTGFIGPFVIRQLQEEGHNLTVFHRGKSPAPAGVKEIIGDRNSLSDFRDKFAREKFDLVLDFVLVSERQARQFMDVFRGITSRVVVLSSGDAYRAWGVFYGVEPGDLEPLPLTEDSALRTVPPFPPEAVKRSAEIVSYINAEYDKVPTERVVLSDPKLPATVLRLPMIYGPGDYVHRFYQCLKRMDDQRPFIVFADEVAAMRTPRGYVEDVAMGITLATLSERAAGRIYNICEQQSFSELEWARKIAAATGWQGEFVVLPHDKTPKHLLWPYNTRQHIVVSSERIRRELGYREIIPESQAFARTIQWERANPPKAPGAPFDYNAEDVAVNNLKASA